MHVQNDADAKLIAIDRENFSLFKHVCRDNEIEIYADLIKIAK